MRNWGVCWAMWTDGRNSGLVFVVSAGHLGEGVGDSTQENLVILGVSPTVL